MMRLPLYLAMTAVLAACSPGDRQATNEDEKAIPWESGYVQANGIRLHYWRTGGAGKPAWVMAHGITDYGLNWTSLARKFEDDYDLIMYDARGHGLSDKPEGPLDLQTHAEDLVGLIRALDLEKPILMGHSMGGATVALVGAMYPEVPRALILEDPADMLLEEDGLNEGVIPDWKEMVRTDRETEKEALMEVARTERHPGWTDLDYELWAESKRLVDPDVVDILRYGGFGSAAETYPRITAPTLILKADANEERRRRFREMASLLEKGRIVFITGAGHVVRNDRPVETEREIRGFLAESR